MPEIQTDLQFYTPWPKFGKRLNFQWGESRHDIAILKAVARAQVQDVETGDDEVNASRILAGLEFGELTTNSTSFKNQFRLFYDKDADKFCIQRNTGIEAAPTWVDYLCIAQSNGLVTVNGLDAGSLGVGSDGGFYGLPDQRMQRIGEAGGAAGTMAIFTPPNTDALWFNSQDFYLTEIKGGAYAGTPVVNSKNSFGLARTFNASGGEWIINHNFGISPVMAQVFDDQDRVIIPDEIDVSNPNTAYFYFDSSISGKVIIATGGLGVAEIAPLDPFYLLVRSSNRSDVPRFDDFADMVFEAADFYISYREPQHQARIKLGNRFAALSARVDGIQSGQEDKFYGITVKHSNGSQSFRGLNTVAFNVNDFYVTQNSPNTDEVVVSLRANPQLLDHGNLTGLSDNDHPQYLLKTETPPGFYGIYVRESDGNPPAFKNDTVIFDSSHFYLHPNSVGKPTVSFRGLDHGALAGLADNDHPQYLLKTETPPGFYGIVVKQSDNLQHFRNINVINFEAASFYLEQNATNPDEVIVNFRGSAGSGGGGGISGVVFKESDDNPSSVTADTLVFHSEAFYIGTTSTGKASVAYRGNVNAEANTASNVGAGEGVFAQKSGVDLQLKSLVAGSNITITSDTDEITIASTASGSGSSIFYSKLRDLEDVKITNPQIYDLLQFYSTQEGGSNKWVNRGYLQFRPIATESTSNIADFPDQQRDNVAIYAANELGSTRVKLWVKSALQGATENNDPPYDLSRDNVTTVNNNSGSTITRGQLVYINGGILNNPRVSLANAASATTMPAIGAVFSTSINNGSLGSILLRGIIGGIDTSAFTSGALLYVSDTTAGGYTSTPPQAGPASIRQPIGIVTRANATVGRIYFNFALIDDAIGLSDGKNSHSHTQNLGVNHNQFYLSRNAGRTVINWDLREAFRDLEVTLSGNSKNINWDWSAANSFNLKLQKNTTLHTPTNRPDLGRAQQVNLVVKQPAVGFYNVTFSKKFKFSGGDQSPPTLRANAVDLYSFHISSAIGRDFIITTQASDLFY